MDIDLYRRGRKYYCDKVAATLPGTQHVLLEHALGIAEFAKFYLREANATRVRFHDLPSPTISVQRRDDVKYGHVDYYVCLEAYESTPKRAMKRALAIEYGHRYESKKKNRSGPWNQSHGLHVLGRAVDSHAAFADLGGG